MQRIFDLVCSLILLVQIFFVARYCKGRNREILLLRQQERFLGEMAVQYTQAGDLKEAIQKGVDPRDRLMEEEANRLLDFLEEDGAHRRMDYLSQVKNPFFAVFYAMCHTVRSLGDISFRGQSLFVNNVQYIEEEVRMEILRIQNTGYRFSGLLGLSVVPFFLIPLIQAWALSIESGMESFYAGSYGIGTTLACGLASSLVLLLVLWLRFPDLRAIRSYRIESVLLKKPFLRYLVDARIGRHYSKYLRKNEELKKLQGFGNIRQFLVRRCLWAVAGTVLVLAGSCLVRLTGRFQLYHEVVVPSSWTVELDEGEKAVLEQRLVLEFQRLVSQKEAEVRLDSRAWREYSLQIQNACVMLLEQQKRAYDKIRFSWIDAVLCIVGGLAGWLLPELELGICRWNVEQQKMEETLRFQTMILTLRSYPQITVEDILGWLESFSGLFRRAFERALDSFSYDRQQSLQRLKEDAGYEPVGRIADALKSCDDVLIQNAFLNMEAERNYYMDQYKQKVQAWTRERAAIGRICAYLPFLLVLALKLVVPFVLQGIGQLDAYRGSFMDML